MTVAVRLPEADTSTALRHAMRHMAGGVSVITAGAGADLTGLTVTSAASLSMDPPAMLICVNRSASAWPVIQRYRHFAVNILSAAQEKVADRFAGRGGVKGAARYEGSDWRPLASGALGLVGALAVIDCRVDEILERNSHGIIIGAVLSATEGDGPSRDPLVYGHGRFKALPLSDAEAHP